MRSTATLKLLLTDAQRQADEDRAVVSISPASPAR